MLLLAAIGGAETERAVTAAAAATSGSSGALGALFPSMAAPCPVSATLVAPRDNGHLAVVGEEAGGTLCSEPDLSAPVYRLCKGRWVGAPSGRPGEHSAALVLRGCFQLAWPSAWVESLGGWVVTS